MKAWHHDRQLVLATCCFNLAQPLLRRLLLLSLFFFFFLQIRNLWNEAVATLEILSKVFLFHFEKISRHFSLFRVFQNVSVNTGRNSRFGRHEVCALKKKKFLKPKQICILYTEKSQKEKKNEMKWNVQSYLLYNKL